MNHNSDLQNSSTESTPKVPDASRYTTIMSVVILWTAKSESVDQYLSRAESLMNKYYLSTENDPFKNHIKRYLIFARFG